MNRPEYIHRPMPRNNDWLRKQRRYQQYSDAAMWWPNEDWSWAVGRERETRGHQARGREK